MARKYGNMETQRLHDRTHEATEHEPEEVDHEGQDGASEHDHEGQEGDHEVIQGVVAEHGPADSHEHTMEGEHHKVVSHHGAHTHTSSGHPSHEHAHEHIGHAMGVAPAHKQEDEEMTAGAAEEGEGMPAIG
jgi:hypothetical protein